MRRVRKNNEQWHVTLG